MADDVRDLHWTAEVSFLGPIERHKEIAVRRFREMADHIDRIPNEVFVRLVDQSQGRSTGGICGEPFRGTDISSGWRGLWSVVDRDDL